VLNGEKEEVRKEGIRKEGTEKKAGVSEGEGCL
jgi:hypothetical protein